MHTSFRPHYNPDLLDVLSNRRINLNSNPLDEIDFLSQRLDISSIERLRCELNWARETLLKVISINTRDIGNYKKGGQLLNITVVENIVELAKVATVCLHYFGSVERWNRWLNQESIQFNNAPPLAVIHTIRGRELIKKMIVSLQNGYAA